MKWVIGYVGVWLEVRREGSEEFWGSVFVFFFWVVVFLGVGVGWRGCLVVVVF